MTSAQRKDLETWMKTTESGMSRTERRFQEVLAPLGKAFCEPLLKLSKEFLEIRDLIVNDQKRQKPLRQLREWDHVQKN